MSHNATALDVGVSLQCQNRTPSPHLKKCLFCKVLEVVFVYLSLLCKAEDSLPHRNFSRYGPGDISATFF